VSTIFPPPYFKFLLFSAISLAFHFQRVLSKHSATRFRFETSANTHISATEGESYFPDLEFCQLSSLAIHRLLPLPFVNDTPFGPKFFRSVWCVVVFVLCVCVVLCSENPPVFTSSVVFASPPFVNFSFRALSPFFFCPESSLFDYLGLVKQLKISLWVWVSVEFFTFSPSFLTSFSADEFFCPLERPQKFV